MLGKSSAEAPGVDTKGSEIAAHDTGQPQDLLPGLGLFFIAGGVISLLLSFVVNQIARGILIAIGVLTFCIQRIGLIQIYWGALLCALGFLAFRIHRRGMFILLGFALLAAGLINAFGGRLTGWTALAIPQFILGLLIMSWFRDFAPRGEMKVIPSERPIAEGEPVNPTARTLQKETGSSQIGLQSAPTEGTERASSQFPKAARVFISYSRKDIAFARVLNDMLLARGLESWIDWQDIPPSADWMAEVYAAIESADAFVFVVSRTSIDSEICSKEIAHAIKNRKRLIPIVLQDVDPSATPKVIADLNWIFFREGQDDYQQSFDILLQTLHTNLEWVKAHTRLQVRALEWENRQRDESFLLRGQDLQDAQQRLAQVGAGWNPQPSEVQRQYVLASIALREREISEREEAHRRELKAQTRIRNIAISIALVAMLVVGLICAGYNPFAQIYGLFAGSNPGQAWAVAFSPDNKLVAISNAETAINIWDLTTGRSLGQPLNLHTNYILSLAFSPDSDMLASGSGDTTVRLWDVATSLPINQPLRGGIGRIYALAFSPNGRILASAGSNAVVQLWDVSTGQPIGQPLTGHAGPVSSIAFSPDGKILASGSLDKTIRLWNVATHQQLGQPLTLHTTGVTFVIFSPDGKTLASASSDGSILLWDVMTAQPLGPPLSGHLGRVNSLTFSPDGKILASGSSDRTIRLWNLATSQTVRQLYTGQDINRAAHGSEVIAVIFNPDGRTLASASLDKSIRLWDVASGQLLSQPIVSFWSPIDDFRLWGMVMVLLVLIFFVYVSSMRIRARA